MVLEIKFKCNVNHKSTPLYLRPVSAGAGGVLEDGGRMLCTGGGGVQQPVCVPLG